MEVFLGGSDATVHKQQPSGCVDAGVDDLERNLGGNRDGDLQTSGELSVDQSNTLCAGEVEEGGEVGDVEGSNGRRDERRDDGVGADGAGEVDDVSVGDDGEVGEGEDDVALGGEGRHDSAIGKVHSHVEGHGGRQVGDAPGCKGEERLQRRLQCRAELLVWVLCGEWRAEVAPVGGVEGDDTARGGRGERHGEHPLLVKVPRNTVEHGIVEGQSGERRGLGNGCRPSRQVRTGGVGVGHGARNAERRLGGRFGDAQHSHVQIDHAQRCVLQMEREVHRLRDLSEVLVAILRDDFFELRSEGILGATLYRLDNLALDNVVQPGVGAVDIETHVPQIHAHAGRRNGGRPALDTKGKRAIEFTVGKLCGGRAGIRDVGPRGLTPMPMEVHFRGKSFHLQGCS
mmetsp:Transcript_5551/g.12239  ORF Transcript_5551/g.12239 Transcript_5551/m.12239 type:complete len:400 (+) Transcript_5551:69-1268(+)